MHFKKKKKKKEEEGKAVYDCCIALIEYVWGSVCGNWRGLWGKCKWTSLKIPTEFFQLEGPVKTNERYQRRIDFVRKLEGVGGPICEDKTYTKPLITNPNFPSIYNPSLHLQKALLIKHLLNLKLLSTFQQY